ncbi:uncharacterized protein LOC105698161 isoform X2 [Orussus abietinus]|uniref:uncharacterized protein LOC105698161 isoform X2 n=1 Tax=Orussus abietinus TaxID=222816 RepID=UPI0006256533|nr:uncharacterized protein LOC105698161 isoform X2 [Orussus abietinus]
MNSKEENDRNDAEPRIDRSIETNDNLSFDQSAKPCKTTKLQNRMSNEQFKVNNNIGDVQCSSPFKPPIMLTNGVQEMPSNAAEFYLNSSAIDMRADTSNPNSTSLFTSTQPTKFLPLNTNASMEKCPPKVSCSSDSSPEVDPTWTSNSYKPKCILNNISGSIGSTSQGTCRFLRPNINGNKEVAGPSGMQKVSHREQERRDSSSGNEGDMSDGEDYCIYTYKGNDDSICLDIKQQQRQEQIEVHEVDGQHHSDRSSPEMDFLEMDFDPGPSCEQDTGDSDLASINEDVQNIALDNVEADAVSLNDLSSGRVVSRQSLSSSTQNKQESSKDVNHETNHLGTDMESRPDEGVNQTNSLSRSLWIPSTSTGIRRWEATGLYRTSGCPLRESHGHHNTNGDLISPSDSRDTDAELWADSSTVSVPESSNLNSRKNNLSSTLYHRMMAKKLMLNKQAAFNQSGDSNLETDLCNERLDGLLPVEKVMLWNEQEATVKQVTQIATSACGATAAINALLALNIAFSLEVLVRGVATRLREPGTPLPRYLVSRSLAGSTHKDLARGISLATSGAAITKFFAFYPERKVSLSHWLHYWISRGAAPIATLNLQHCGEGNDIPDAWHHQMIFGVGPGGIYLTNPVQCLPEQVVWHQLVNPSVLLVRRADVLAHWNSTTDLTPLTLLNQRWRKLNVLGQVVNMVRETMWMRQQPAVSMSYTTHIRIPASYEAGITLVMSSEAPAATELMLAEQLPLL